MNIFKNIFGRKEPPQPRRTLPQRMAEAEENIEQLWLSFDALTSDMGGIAGRLDKLETEPSIPLPDGYEWQEDPETGEQVPIFVGEPLEQLEPVEEVPQDGE